MGKTVEVTIPVDADAAAALQDARNREAVGRLVSRVLRRGAGPSPLARAITAMKAEARAAGLTDTEIDAELAAYNAEARDCDAARAAAARIRERRKGVKLNGSKIKDLIAKDRR